MQKPEEKSLKKKNLLSEKKKKNFEYKFGDKLSKNNNANPRPGTTKKKSTSTQKGPKKGNVNKIEEEMPLPEPKPLEAVQKIPENKIDEEDKDEEEKMPEIPIEGANKYDFKLYKHLKENMKNRENLCHDGISNDSLYCLDCKVSVCPKCESYNQHNGHQLVNKLPYYKCEKDFIESSFKDIESVFSSNPTYLNVNIIKRELKTQITDKISELINQLNKVKEAKMEEVEKIFDVNENCVEKLKENELKAKNNLNKFLEKQKNFFCIDTNEGVESKNINPEANEVLKNLEGEKSPMGMIQPNKDTVNSTFLLTYDLIKNTEFMNNLIKDIINEIKENTEKYVNEFNEKAKEAEEAINR